MKGKNIEKILKLYDEGKTVKEISEELYFTFAHVYNVLRLHKKMGRIRK